jgi:glucose-1-phosphate adenylyltransferase
MDLLRPDSELTPEACDIRTNQTAHGLPYDRPPAKIVGTARLLNSAVSPACTIAGAVEDSILSPGVVVEKGASVKNSIIMHDCVIKQGARIERTIIDKDVVIGENCIIGKGDKSVANTQFPDHVYSGLTVVGKRASVPARMKIGTNCIIYPEVTGRDFKAGRVTDGETVAG